MSFLPKVPVTTIVWAGKEVLKNTSWYSAIGDDLSCMRPTIELNWPRIFKDKADSPEAAIQIIKSWLLMYILLSTRQDLINKGVRGDLYTGGEEELAKANYKIIWSSPVLLNFYTDLAIDSILGSKPYLNKDWDALRDLLDIWRNGVFIRELEVRGMLDRQAQEIK